MTGTPVRFGRYRTSADPDWALIGNGEQLAYIANKLNSAIIVYELGAWMGRYDGSPSNRIFLAHTSGPSQVTQKWPGDVIAYTSAFTPSSNQTTWDTGSVHIKPITPVVVNPGYYALGITSYGGRTGCGMIQAASITGESEAFWRRSIGSTVPTNPVEGTKTNEGHMTVWATGEVNVKPNNPTGLSPSGTISGTNMTPTFTANFSDPNETLNNGTAYDKLTSVQIRVLQGSTVKWDVTYNANSTEQSQRKSSRTYAGSALAHNISYTYQVRHKDRNGLWSNWASTTFTLQGLATVDAPTAPKGFVTTNTPSPITAVYRHAAGTAANAMQVRLHSSSGAVMSTSNSKAVSVANNGTLSMTWAETGFGGRAWGATHGISVRARDANNVWAVNWSPITYFRVNAAPTTPTNLAPSGGTAYAVRPLLSCYSSEPDPEQGRPTVYAEILTSGGSLIATRTMTPKAGNRYEYQTTAADLAAYGSYKWRAYSYDGIIYSGATTSAASAARSTEATFAYADVPAVTITGPSSPIETISPTIIWSRTLSGGATQTHFQVIMVDPVTGNVVYQTPEFALSSAVPHTIQSSYWQQNEAWNNNETFNVIVRVRDSNGLWGQSDPWPLTLEYEPADAILLEGEPVSLERTMGEVAIRLNWSQSNYPEEEFVMYRITRTEVGGVGMTGESIVLAEITDAGTTTLLDAEVTSRAQYRYEITQVILQGNDHLESEPSEWVGGVTFDGVVLHMPFNPESMHVHLRWSLPDSNYAPGILLGQNVNLITPVSNNGRIAIFSPGHTHDPYGEFTIRDDEIATADIDMDALASMFHAQNGDHDGSPHVMCWRDGRGGRHGRIYGILINPDFTHHRNGAYTVRLQFNEVTFELGVR